MYFCAYKLYFSVCKQKLVKMKKELALLLIGMVVVIIGSLLKIGHYDFSSYVLIVGLAIEAYVLGSLVLKALRKK